MMDLTWMPSGKILRQLLAQAWNLPFPPLPMFFRRMPLLLSELRLSDSQKTCLQVLSKEQRQALFDACDHIFLTFADKSYRVAAQGIQKYLMKLTLRDDKSNMLDQEKDGFQSRMDQYAHLFSQ